MHWLQLNEFNNVIHTKYHRHKVHSITIQINLKNTNINYNM